MDYADRPEYLFFNYDEDDPIPVVQKPYRCPILLNFLINTVMGVFFGIYAWNNPDDSECYAWPDSKAAIVNPIGLPDSKNVTQ